MKISLTNSDVTTAIQAFIAQQFPALAGADVALDYSLSRGPNAQLSIDLHIGADAEAYRATEAAKPVFKPAGRKAATVDVEVAGEVEEQEEEELEEEAVAAAPAKRFAPRKA